MILRLPKKLQLLKIGLPIILAAAVFAVTRLALPVSAATYTYIDIPATQVGTINVVLETGSMNPTDSDCYFFTITGLTDANAQYNGMQFYMGDTGNALRLLAGIGNYNIVVDGTGCATYPDGALNINLQGVTLGAMASGIVSPLRLQNHANVELTVDGTNTFSAGYTLLPGACIGYTTQMLGYAPINVPADNTITINSTTGGRLTTVAGSNSFTNGAAGIGGNGTSMTSNTTLTCINYNQAAGTINIGGNVFIAAKGNASYCGAGGASIGAGGTTAMNDSIIDAIDAAGVLHGGVINISDQATIFTNHRIGSGIAYQCSDDYSEIDTTGIINITNQPFVMHSPSSSDGFDWLLTGASSITGGSLYSTISASAAISGTITDGFSNNVYPLYIPTTLSPSGQNTANTDVDFNPATPSISYTLHTITPAQQAWFTSSGASWPIGNITAQAWLPASASTGSGTAIAPYPGTPYSNVTIGATTTAFADQRPVYATYTQALNNVYNHLYSALPVTNVTTPANQTVLANGSASFSSTVSLANPALSPAYTPIYQWQVSTNSGSTWTNLMNDTGITGSTTTTLSLTNVPAGWNGYQYRLLLQTPTASAPYAGAPITGKATLLTTTPAILTVTQPYLTLTSSSSVNINLNQVTSSLGSNNSVLAVATNVSTGYSLSISIQGNDTRLADGAGHYINSTTSTLTSPLALPTNTWGFAMDNSAAIVGNGFDASYTTPIPNITAKFAGVPANTNPLLIRKTAAANESGDNVTIYYGAHIDMSKPSGTYSGTVLHTAITN
ncbi:hypothetical protein FWF48_03070 [Candidatus Saccharibacteria bacterium]|nr:hypothetical protein [Candidatus Saccharibacteria bacterium]